MASALIVDDSTFMKGVLRFILERGGHSVVTMVDRGNEAMEAYSRLCPDLVFCDLFVDGSQGLSLISSLLQAHPEAKVIAVAPGGHDTEVRKALESGARAYLEKPYDVVGVHDAIRKALRGRP